MSKRPAFQFYPSDWRNDPGLRLCTAAARGFWMDLLCLMHEGEPYGHLTVLGRAAAPDALARLTGESVVNVKRWLGELRSNAVFSETAEGVIYSRRMTRDEGVRDARAAGGAAGGEHGAKGAGHGGKGGRPRTARGDMQAPERGDKKPPLKPPPSSSSSSSYSDPNGSVSSDVRKADVDRLWALATNRGRERSGRKDVQRALRAAVRRGGSMDEIARSVERYYASADATKNAGEYAKGLHRLIENDRWRDLPESPPPFDPMLQPEDWRQHRWMAEFAEGKFAWDPRRGPKPGEPGCRVAPEIQREFGVEPAPPRQVGSAA